MMSRKIGLPLTVVAIALTIVVVLIFAFSPSTRAEAAALFSGRLTAAKAAEVESTAASVPTPSTTATANASAIEPAKTVAPEGMSVYVTKKGDSVPGIVRRFLPQTEYMTGSELEAALRKQNPDLKGVFPKPNMQIVVPGMLPNPLIVKPRSVPKDFEVRAIYLTGTMAGSAKGLEMIRHWRELGGNSVVFDVKDSDGLVNVPFQHKLSNDKYQPIRNLPKLVRYLHSLNMHAIARIAIFRDEYLVQQRPELGVKSRKTGQAWRENGKLVWVDPSNQAIQEYNIALAKYAAESGVDEVQFDYVRFPAEGDQKDAQFAYETTHPKWQRADVITNFLADAQQALKPYNVLFSLDVFGVMAWQRNVDLLHTGQDIVQMAKHCDVLSPMIYPSHFYGMDGYALPGDAPEHFIGSSMDRFRLITKDTGVVLRPWLQAFGWKTKTYSPEYIRTQVAVSKQKGGIGFLFWNARNDYSKPYAAMPDMRAAGEKYLRGDEVGKPSVPEKTSIKTAAQGTL